MGDFSKPSAECDIIMKGGATSGIVYPKAVLALAETYRFRSIGGASAGAVAAAITAAAEYGRGAGGFERIATIPDYISANLASLFQPDERAKDIFEVVEIAGLKKNYLPALGKLLAVAWTGTAIGLVLGIVLAVIAYTLGGGWPAIVLALFIGCCAAVIAAVWVFAKKAMALLVSSNFGLCSGRTAKGSKLLAVTDWLTQTIEDAAGPNTPDGKPRQVR